MRVCVCVCVCVCVRILPRWLSNKESTCNAGDVGSNPGLGRSPGGGHGNLLQYSCLENLKDRGTWQATVHRVTKSWKHLRQLSTAQHFILSVQSLSRV